MSVTQDESADKGGSNTSTGEAAMEPQDTEKPGKPTKTVVVTVGDDDVETPMDTTPGALLRLAGLDPAVRQLVLVQGKHQEAYGDNDAAIHVHPHERFITVSTGGTPVS
jgi:hypothetical protein